MQVVSSGHRILFVQSSFVFFTCRHIQSRVVGQGHRVRRTFLQHSCVGIQGEHARYLHFQYRSLRINWPILNAVNRGKLREAFEIYEYDSHGASILAVKQLTTQVARWSWPAGGRASTQQSCRGNLQHSRAVDLRKLAWPTSGEP